MGRIELSTLIAAPRERCFDLSLSVDFHTRSTAETGETAVAGKLTGLLALGEEVTWRAHHFGVWQSLTSRITAYDRPVHFRDSMVQGAFERFDHDHSFDPAPSGQTVLRDVIDYNAPLGLLGRLVERTILTRHLVRFLEARNRILKVTAESDGWKQFLLP